MKYLKQIAYILLLIGGINWGVYGVSGYDVVEVLFGQIPMIANLIYVFVGLSAFYIIVSRFALCECKTCDSKKETVSTTSDTTCSCSDSSCTDCAIE